MSLFRKPKKVIQRRVFTENDDEDEEVMEIQPVPAEPSKDKKKKDKSMKNKPTQALLSFETEEEGPIFQVKKSSHSKKIMREKERKKKEAKVEKEEFKVKDEIKKEIITDDLIVVVNSSHKKPPTPPPPPILSGRDALCAGKDDLSSEDEEDSSVAHRFSKPNNFQKVLQSGAIPDAAMIHAARKRRQRAREMGDFVPVEEEKPVDTGRLIREDDNDASDDERIDMDVNHSLRDQERRREQFLAAQESDHEIDDWENQQIRKGVTAAALAQQEYVMDYQTEVVQPIQPQASIIDPGIPRTPQMIYDKLKEHYQNVKSSFEANLRKYENLNEEINNVTQELEDIKHKAPFAAKKYQFYQELRGYIQDLVECFDEKVEVIGNLEQRALDLMAKRSEWLVERRRQDIRDQAEEATSKGMLRKDPEDEEKVRRAAEREGRRTRRRRVREMAGIPRHVEGMSSDEEIPQQDLISFEKEREQIESEAQTVLDDVVDDFSSLASILIKFEQWRETDITSYNEAFATLCLPKVVTPLVRLNMIFWDPLSESVDLEKLDWYRTLAMYGLHDDETESSLSKDPDYNLLPTIVEKLIVAKLTQLVDKCWDPVSSSQTLRLVGAISRYIKKYPTLGPASKPLNNLFNAILHKMKSSLEHDVFIPITPKLADSKSPFFQRQFASGLKLLKNITSWQGIFNDNTLKELALTALLNRYLLSSIKFCMLTDAVSKVGLISLILPRVWLQSDTPELQLFRSSILNLFQQLDKNNPLHLESIETVNNILKTLRTLN